MAPASSTTARNLRVAETYTDDVRGEGGVKKQVHGSAQQPINQGLRYLTSAD